MKVLQICAYAAPYEANFMKSLYTLEAKMKASGYDTIYAFPDKTEKIKWCEKLSRRAKVYFLPLAKARILPSTYLKLKEIYRQNPDLIIIHSHFELYDIPISITRPKSIKVFWHLHDPICNDSIKSSFLNKLQYAFLSKNISLLSVCDFYKNFVIESGFPKGQAATIGNGIYLERARNTNRTHEDIFTFLTFGWDFYRKGSDLILMACKKLYKDNKITLTLVGNNSTWNNKIFKIYQNEPWLIQQNFVEDINLLFNNARCFIQASRSETFSYAVAEAVYAGLPVIASDIPGLKWAKNLPSVISFENESLDELYEVMKKMVSGDLYFDSNNIEKSRSIIEQNYSAEVWAERIIKQYQIISSTPT